MFYDKNLMNSKSLGGVWRAGHDMNEESNEELSMANICDKLDSWIDSSHEETHRRLSLRASAIFIDGAARLYKRKMELLFEDTQRLDRDMSRRKRFRSSIDNDIDISQTFTDPELQETSKSNLTVSYTKQDINNSELYNSGNKTDNDTSDMELTSILQHTTSTNQKTDKAVQTSPKPRKNRLLDPSRTFDRNLPFGFVVVHDNYSNRIPSRIIFSSLNPDAGKIV